MAVMRLQPPGGTSALAWLLWLLNLQANRISFFLELFNARAAGGSETWDFASHGLSCRTFKEKFAQCLLGRDPGVGAKKEPFLPPYLISAQWVPERTCLRLAY